VDSFVRRNSADQEKKIYAELLNIPGIGDVYRFHVVVDSMPAGGSGLTDSELRASEVPVLTRIWDGADIALVSAAGRLLVELPAGGSGLTDAELRATPVPVSLPPGGGGLTDTELRATPVPVSGTIAVTGPLTDAQLRALAVAVSGPLTDAQLRAVAVPISGALTDGQLRATPVPVSGTVTASGPLTDAQLRAVAVPVSGTVTASGPLTDTQLRNSAVPVSGPLTDGQLRATSVPVSGAVSVNNFPALQLVSGPVTNTELRASAVPVSGPLTDGQLRASAVPVSLAAAALRIGAVYHTGGQLVDENGTLRAVNRAFIDTSASGDTPVVGAQGGAIRIRVLAASLVVAAAVSARFRSATTSISALKALAANGGFVYPYNPHGWFQTAANEALNLNLGGAIAAGGDVIWCQAT